MKLAPRWPFTFSRDLAAVHFDQTFYQRKSQSQTSGFGTEHRLRLRKRLENARHELFWYSDSRVGHRELRTVSVFLHAYFDVPMRRRELQRVVQQVADNLLNPRWIGFDPRALRRDVDWGLRLCRHFERLDYETN